MSTLAEPLPFKEALAMREVKTILPTELRTAMLQELPAALHQRAMFSAGVMNAEFLQRAHDGIQLLVEGKTDRATQRVELKKLMRSLGMSVPEPGEGDLTDLGSDKRLNLILDMGVQQAQGYGRRMEGMQPDIRDQWPAREFYDTNPGYHTNRREDGPDPWTQRWIDAGGKFYDGRMIALIDDPIWTELNRFGVDYPPFDFNSYWDLRDIDRDEAIDLGLIDRDTQVAPDEISFNAELAATPDIRAGWLRTGLLEALPGLVHFVGDVLKFTGGTA